MYPGEVTEDAEWMEDFEAIFGTLGSVPAFMGQLQGAVLSVINKAVAEEREACAKIAESDDCIEEELMDDGSYRLETHKTMKNIAEAIRERGEGIAVA